MTTPLERFGALLRGTQPDRVPIVCNLLDQGASELGLSLRDYYANGDLVAEAQLRMQARYGYDQVWGSHYAARDAEVLGSRRTIFVADGPPNVGDLILDGLDDIDRLEIPLDPSAHPALAAELRTFARLRSEVGGTIPILGMLVGAFSLPPMLMGMSRWLELLVSGPADARATLLEKCSDYCIRRAAGLRAAGADLLVYANPVATTTFLQRSRLLELALPWIRRDLAGIGLGGLVYFTGGGRLGPMLTAIRDATGCRAYYLHPEDDLLAARRELGPGLLVMPINDIPLARWDEPTIEREVAHIMSEGKPGGAFVFGTLVMPLGIPEANIHALIAAARRHGVYPDA